MNSYITHTRGEVTVPGDKSISHRSIMLGSIAKGTTRIKGFLEGEDCLSTIDCFKKLGIKIEKNGDMISVFGQGLHGLKAPSDLLYTGNSGTTTRLMAGILAAQSFDKAQAPVRLVLGVLNEDNRAVIGDIGNGFHTGVRVGKLIDVHIPQLDQGMLRHEGHGVDRLLEGVCVQCRTVDALITEIVLSFGEAYFFELKEILLPKIVLRPPEKIEALRPALLQGTKLSRIIECFFFFLSHVPSPYGSPQSRPHPFA